MKMIDKFFGNIGISIFLVAVYRSYIFNLFCFEIVPFCCFMQNSISRWKLPLDAIVLNLQVMILLHFPHSVDT